MFKQLSLFDIPEIHVEKKVLKGQPINLLPLNDYDHIIISESGGKDSITCLFKILDYGVAPSKIELWHQCVDGNFDNGNSRL